MDFQRTRALRCPHHGHVATLGTDRIGVIKHFFPRVILKFALFSIGECLGGRTPRRKRFTSTVVSTFRTRRQEQQTGVIGVSRAVANPCRPDTPVFFFVPDGVSTFDGSMQINRLSPDQKNICHSFSFSFFLSFCFFFFSREESGCRSIPRVSKTFYPLLRITSKTWRAQWVEESMLQYFRENKYIDKIVGYYMRE